MKPPKFLAARNTLPFARTICDFILNDLNRSEETETEVCFSYSPLDQTRVFNASLLAAETLAVVGRAGPGEVEPVRNGLLPPRR